MGHAVTQLMNDRNAELRPLEYIVEVDKACVGGAPCSGGLAPGPRFPMLCGGH